MSRHFFGLYILIILTLAAVSWGQDKLLQSYGSRDLLDDRSQAVALHAVDERLRGIAPADWNAVLAALSLGILPVVVLYVLFSRNLIRGMTSGAVK